MKLLLLCLFELCAIHVFSKRTSRVSTSLLSRRPRTPTSVLAAPSRHTSCPATPASSRASATRSLQRTASQPPSSPQAGGEAHPMCTSSGRTAPGTASTVVGVRLGLRTRQRRSTSSSPSASRVAQGGSQDTRDSSGVPRWVLQSVVEWVDQWLTDEREGCGGWKRRLNGT